MKGSLSRDLAAPTKKLCTGCPSLRFSQGWALASMRVEKQKLKAPALQMRELNPAGPTARPIHVTIGDANGITIDHPGNVGGGAVIEMTKSQRIRILSISPLKE